MPEPTTPWSTDYPVYHYAVNPLANKICFIHPNIISMIAILITFPVAYYIYKRASWWLIVALAIARAFLDCLDGAVARKCNLKSKLGALLDVHGDTFAGVVIFATVLYVIWIQRPLPLPARLWWTFLILVALTILVMAVAREWTVGDIDRGFASDLERVLHDNIIGLHILGAILYKLVLA